MKVFVYGSLMEGQRNHRLLANACFLRTARTNARFSLHDLGPYPALVAHGRTSVHGEVYEVDAVTLAALDSLEGHPTVYRRATIVLVGRTRVDTYLMPAERVAKYPLVESGSWRKQCESK